ncbi:hypothetical protein GCM10009798_01670 [Nocardioides panacihumi]|uniref:Fibrinogen C-terminal domain-containing protein n=1 Tax=Nocardioides panacihumi TaxID=400774 RepID=A0ABN2Q7Y2_9ACTN
MGRQAIAFSRVAAGVAAIVTALTGSVSCDTAAAATSSAGWVPDGSSAERAAASCWEIKQVVPTAPDGVYWLVTPTLVAPQQFYCDMSVDGGGWVLVGRGRDGWLSGGDGQGTVAQVHDHVWDQTGFKPRQLSDDVINGLLDGQAPSGLADGVRVVRAADRAGVTATDVRLKLTKMPRWSWAFSAGQPADARLYAASSQRDTAGRLSVSRTGVTTRDLDGGGNGNGSSNGMSRLWTYLSSTNGWVAGFNYGSSVAGTTAADTYLYSITGTYATPMTQVWLRPQLTTGQVAYPSVPDSGAAAQEQAPLAESGALPGTWGVAGLANGLTTELNTEAHAFAQIGNVMYVGGNFARVEEHAGRTPTGPATQTVPQSYLAAFDATTGDWIPGFRPVLDNQVNSLAALPDGRLAVGGQFGTVNGVSQPGLVELDPTTGETVTGWRIRIEDRIAGERVNVQTMDVQDGWLYLGGSFTHLTGGASTSTVYARKAARVKVGDATPDKAWNPDFNGKVQSIDASADGRRVYVSGYFTSSGSTSTMRVAILSTDPGAAVVPFAPRFSVATSPYQQAIHEAGPTLWVGGSEHSMFGYDTTTLEATSLNVTRSGGDIQAIADSADTVVYAGCHCGDWAFSGQQAYSFTVGDPNPTWAEAHAIGYIGAWDDATGASMPAFDPISKARGGYGAWALGVAADGTLWAGGSYTSVIARDGRDQWAGGFVRFAARPHTAPATPDGLTVRLTGQVAGLSWTASTADAVTYEVLRGGRVVATTTRTSVDVPDSAAGDRFFVRATDGHGNRSATTTVAVAQAEPAVVDLVAAGSTWSYRADGAAPAAGWQDATFDDSTWSTGAAPLGWGSPSIATNVDVASGQRPISTYYRRSFDVVDPSALTGLTLTTRADDGVIVYLNGREVARRNLRDGAIGPSTFATAAPRTSAAVADPLVVPLDATALVAGRNEVSVEVHVNFRSTKDVSMDLRLAAQSP